MKFEDFKKELLKDAKYRFNESDLEKDLAFYISNKILESRISKGITQKKLAELVGTEQPSIARIEKGQNLPNLKFLQKVANALNVDVQMYIGPIYSVKNSSTRAEETTLVSSISSTLTSINNSAAN